MVEIWEFGGIRLSDCFSRLSPNLCCLFQALSIEMCFTAADLQRKHDLTWLGGISCQNFATHNKRKRKIL